EWNLIDLSMCTWPDRPRICSHENRKTASQRSLRKFHHALIKRPRVELGVLSVLVEAGSLVRCLAQIESVIHADQDTGRGRFVTKATTKLTDRADRGDYIAIGRAEVHVVAFQKCRPVRREHPFNATTNRPAR